MSRPYWPENNALDFSNLHIQNDNFFHLLSAQICEKVMKVLI